jgi:hypothetical protein
MNTYNLWVTGTALVVLLIGAFFVYGDRPIIGGEVIAAAILILDRNLKPDNR